VAYHKMTGEPVWAAGDDRASYSSPLLATVAGVRQVIVLNHNSVTGHDPADGRVLWRADWPGGHPKVAQPIVLGEDRLLVSSGYGAGCAVFQVSPDPAGDFRVEQLWKNLNMKAKFSNMIRHEGTIYGLDDGVLVALDPMTGRRRWKSGRYGHGQMILAGNLILVQSEAGHLALVEADPLSHVELARIRLFDHKTWNTPALAGRYLLVRTDQQAACYELPVK
jgi:outer membrane protein assembly factor BamB